MNGIYTFLGVDHKCGTSMICQSVAEWIARRKPEWRVLVMHAEADPSPVYTSGSRESMDRLRPELAEETYDADDVVQRSKCAGNLHVISGSDPLQSEGAFHPNHSDHLLRNLSEHFDVILCDSGSHIVHGLTLGSLFAAHGILLVAVQTETCLRRFERLLPLYERLNVRTLGCLINRHQNHHPFTASYFKARLGSFSAPFFTVCESSHGSLAETEGRSLVHYRDRTFSRDIERVAGLILKDMGRELAAERAKEPWKRMTFKNTSNSAK